LDGPGWAVEGSEESVANRLDLSTLEALELPPDHGVVTLETVAPGAVSESARLGRGVDDVGEEHRGKNPIRLSAMAAPVRNSSISSNISSVSPTQ
jgi:hypothetical protein